MSAKKVCIKQTWQQHPTSSLGHGKVMWPQNINCTQQFIHGHQEFEHANAVHFITKSYFKLCRNTHSLYSHDRARGSVELYCAMAPQIETLPNSFMLAKVVQKNSPPTCYAATNDNCFPNVIWSGSIGLHCQRTCRYPQGRPPWG